MTKLAEADGGPSAKLNVDSLWSILQHGAAFDRHRTALIAPQQPTNHLSGLVRSLPSSTEDGSWHGLGARRLATKWTSLSYIIGSLISWSLPAPRTLGCLTWSFAELERASMRVASVLTAHEIKPGSTILLIVPSSAEWVLMLWVCAFRCYTVVTTDQVLLEDRNAQQLQEHIDQLSPSVIVVTTPSEAAAVNRLAANRKPFLGITVDKAQKPLLEGWTSLPDIANSNYPEEIDTTPTPDSRDRVAMIIYTSGTSNHKPKACLRTVSELLGPFTVGSSIPPLGPPVTLVNTKSYQAIAPCLLFATWYSGNAAALAGGLFNPETTISTAAACRPLAMTLMVQMSDTIRGHADYSAEKVKSLRFVQLIGSTITLESLRRTKRAFPNAKVSAGFGMTEAACMIGWPNGPPKLEAMPSYRGIVASGSVLPGAKIKLVNDKGDVVGRNEPGTLHLSGDMVSKGYISGCGADSFYEKDGTSWYATTDCALMDNDGLVYVLGRCDGMITRGGITIAPGSIENLLETEFRSTAIVVTVTSDGERTPYAVFDKLPQKAADIENLVVQKLGSNYTLGKAMDLHQLRLDEWPRNIAGKISIKDVELAVANYVHG